MANGLAKAKKGKKADALPVVPPKVPNARRIEIPVAKGECVSKKTVELALGAAASNAAICTYMTPHSWGELDLTDCVTVLGEQIKKAQTGDLSDLEGMLAGQAIALNSIFQECARRSALNMGEHMGAAEMYMRIGLRAQGQSCAAIKTLGELKNPRPVAFVQQANISNGPQQVNNGPAPPPPEETAIPQNRLLEGTNVTRLDTRATSGTGRSHPPLEAVARVHGAKVARRQSAG